MKTLLALAVAAAVIGGPLSAQGRSEGVIPERSFRGPDPQGALPASKPQCDAGIGTRAGGRCDPVRAGRSLVRTRRAQ